MAGAKLKKAARARPSDQVRFGAGNGTRTRDINLGKVALYQLSYSRTARRIVVSVLRRVKHRASQTNGTSSASIPIRLSLRCTLRPTV